ncbi:restriction endonuclease subunit S [Kribbella sp. NPDC054772]
MKNSTGIQRVMTVSAEHGLIDQDAFFSKKVASANLEGYWVINPGDFVYNKSSSKGARWGVVVRYDGDGPAVVTPLYIVFRPRSESIDPDYLRLACNGLDFFESLAGLLREGARSHGLLNVRLPEFFSASIPVAPPAVQRRIADLVGSVDAHIGQLGSECQRLEDLVRQRREAIFQEIAGGGEYVRLGDLLVEVKRPVPVERTDKYFQIGVRSHGRGIFTKDAVTGDDLGSKKVFWIEPGDLVINIVFAWEGAVAVVPRGLSGYCGSHRFPTYRRTDDGDVEYFRSYLGTSAGLALLGTCSPGGAGRNRTLNRRRLMDAQVPLPSPEVQQATVDEIGALESMADAARIELASARAFRSALLTDLMSQEIEISDSYDVLLEKVS